MVHPTKMQPRGIAAAAHQAVLNNRESVFDKGDDMNIDLDSIIASQRAHGKGPLRGT